MSMPTAYGTPTTTTTKPDTKTAALIAAWDWVGQYEADDTPAMNADPDGGYQSTTLENAFEHVKHAGRVKAAYPMFPADMVDAYAMLRRMAQARIRAAQKEGTR